MAAMLTGKMVLVTRASGGIARVSAVLFAREGAWLAISDRNREGAEATAASWRAEAGRNDQRRFS